MSVVFNFHLRQQPPLVLQETTDFMSVVFNFHLRQTTITRSSGDHRLHVGGGSILAYNADPSIPSMKFQIFHFRHEHWSGGRWKLTHHRHKVGGL